MSEEQEDFGLDKQKDFGALSQEELKRFRRSTASKS